jgi:sugar O-acyltransferase (sialic acid O-acetyltransferase NeuD family)
MLDMPVDGDPTTDPAASPADHEDGATLMDAPRVLPPDGEAPDVAAGGGAGAAAEAGAAVPAATPDSSAPVAASAPSATASDPALADSVELSGPLVDSPVPRPVVVLGTGPMALMIAEILEFVREYEVVGLVDDLPDPASGPRRGLPVLGKFDDLAEVAKRWRRLYGAVGFEDNTLRRHHYHRLVRARVRPASAIHPRTSVSSRAITGPGFVAMSGAVVSAAAVLGENVALGPNTVVGYDSRLGDHVHVGAGAVIMDKAKIGANVSVGANAVIHPGVTIGDGTLIGSGAVVTRDLPDNVVAYGVPARVVRKREIHE